MSAENRLFYLDNTPIPESGSLVISGEETKHIKVMRPETGSLINITDGRGTYAVCRVDAVGREEIAAHLVKRSVKHAYPVEITVAFALTKRGKWETIIEKCTEMGALRFIPLITARNAQFAKGQMKRRERIERIAVSAMKQSRRVYKPLVEDPVDVKNLFTRVNSEDKILLLSFGGSGTIDIDRGRYRNVTIVMGPEGGFLDTEEELIREHDTELLSFGEYTLKTETAAIKAVSLVTHIYGDF